MKQKDLDAFAEQLLLTLSDNGFKVFMSKSKKSKSIYLSCLHIPKLIRVSDHGFNYGAYNFTPRHNGNTRANNGLLFFPMSQNGIELLLKEIKNDFPLVNEGKK
jgi:hypothetical protein